MECWCECALPPGRQTHSDWFHTRVRERLTQRLAALGLQVPSPHPDELPDRRFIVAALNLIDPPDTAPPLDAGRVAQWRAAQAALPAGERIRVVDA